MFFRILFIILSLHSQGYTKPLDLSLKSEAVILVNAETGAILMEKNSQSLYDPASITKIATGLYVLHLKGDKLDELATIETDALASLSEGEKKKAQYKIPPYRLEPDGKNSGLKVGEKTTIHDLLYCCLLASGNDASNALAMAVAGSVPKFMEGLNAYLKSIGCNNTIFYNPHGLFFPGHQTTAYDIALMSMEAMKNGFFRKIVSSASYNRPVTNMQSNTFLKQTNKLLTPGELYYSKAIGVKTGWHSKAKKNLVAAAKDGERTLIAVLLHCEETKEVFKDAKKLFETAFNETKVKRSYFQAGPQTFILQLPRSTNLLHTYSIDEIAYEYYPAEEEVIKCLLYWNNLNLPISKDQPVAELALVNNDGYKVKSYILYAQESVDLVLWAKIIQYFQNMHWFTIIFLLLTLGVFSAFLFKFRALPRTR